MPQAHATKLRQQSAMEYLMTYGWAILIIAVVLASLFQLGVFNSSSFAPRAPPGACQVFRPSGPGTSQNVNLMGVCTGQLPQYAAQFNGQNQYIKAASAGTLQINTLANTYTFTTWFNPSNQMAPAYAGIIGQSIAATANMIGLYYRGGAVWCEAANGGSGSASPVGTWAFAACELYYSAGNTCGTFYYNNGQGGGSACGNTQTNFAAELDVGYAPYSSAYFNGLIANVQVYNTTLSANEIQALYMEGIGGAPIKPQSIVGWWPLNGNANDYSGNNNNGVPTAVTFTSQYGK